MPRPLRFVLAAALCAALAALPPVAPAQDAAAPHRTLFVTVTDKHGNYVRGLKKEDFVVHDGDLRHAPTSLSEAGGPATVGLILDLDESVKDSWLWAGDKAEGGSVREALAHFLERGHPENEYFIVGFDRRPQPSSRARARPATCSPPSGA